MRPPGPHHIFRTDCALHLAPHLPCKVCNQGKKGKTQNLAHSAVASGVQGCGRVGSRRWKMGGESLRIGILQLKQLKAFCSFFSPCPPLLAFSYRFHPFTFGFVDPMLELAPHPSGLQGTAHSCSSWVLAGGRMDMARSCCDSHGGRGQDRKHRSPTRVLIDENSCR